MDLFPGIYEQVINEYLQSKLSSLRPDQKPFKDTIKHYDPQAILSRYIRTITENALRTAEDKNRSLADQIAICNGVISHLADKIGEDRLHQCKITEDAELLLAILDPDQSTALNLQSNKEKSHPLPIRLTGLGKIGIDHIGDMKGVVGTGDDANIANIED